MNFITNKLIIISTVIVVSVISYGISEYVRIENAKAEIIAQETKRTADEKALLAKRNEEAKAMFKAPINYNW